MTGKKTSTFQERIAELIKADGRSQSAIATDFGIAKQTLSAWITGQNSPRDPIVYALSYYFGVSLPWLMGFDVPRTNPSEFSDSERKILDYYRSLSDDAKKTFIDALDQLLDPSELNLLVAYRAADERAQEDALKMLLDHPKKDTASTAG